MARLEYPGTEAGAKQLLEAFLKPGADTQALSRALRPRAKDYAAVFGEANGGKAEAVYGPAWDADRMRVAPKPGQTSLLLWGATSEELKSGAGHATQFPGGYRQVAETLQAGVRLYRFKFVRPGETLGMAYDGLTHVNGRWVIFPKPWRALK